MISRFLDEDLEDLLKPQQRYFEATPTWGNRGKHGLCVVRNWQVRGDIRYCLHSWIFYIESVNNPSSALSKLLERHGIMKVYLISTVWDMNTDMYTLFVKQGSNCILTFLLTIGTLNLPYLHCFLSVHPKSPNPNLSVGSWRWWMSGSQRRRFVRGGGTPIGLGHQWTTGIAAHH